MLGGGGKDCTSINEKLLVGVARETERGLMDPKRVKGLGEAK